VSDDKPKVADENELLQQGKLGANPAEGAARVAPLREIAPPRKIGEPSDVAAEAALLAALLWAASNQPETLRASAVMDLLPNGEPFYERKYGDIYEAMLACLAKNEETGHTPVEHDPVAVAAHAARAGKGRDATGVDALLKLQAAASTVSDVQARAYADSIRSSWAKRCAIRDLRNVATDALSPKVTDVEIFERAQKASLEIMERAATRATTVSIKQSAEQVFKDMLTPGGAAVSTGLKDLDAVLNGGLRAPETSIVAARTSVGKSTLSIGIAEHMCMSDPLAGVLYVSMEMPHKSFTTKLLVSRTPGVTMAAMRRKVLNANQWRDLEASVKSVKDLELHFTVSMTQTLASVFAAASERQRILKKLGKRLVLVIIDHIGLVKASNELLKRATRQQQVAETSRGLRWIASEIGCHVMALAQIHRDAERQKATEGIPKLHHLREAGDIEQDADQIMILHRPRDPGTGLFVSGRPTALVLAKSRMDEETLGMLVDFQKGRYVDWTDTRKTFASEYESKDESKSDSYGSRPSKGAAKSAAPPVSTPPPGFYDDEPSVPTQTTLPSLDDGASGAEVLEQRIVQYVVDAVTLETSLVDLRRSLGNSKRMAVKTVDRGVAIGIEQGLLEVTGSGDDRMVRRVKA
jgi:replicative DNA helicase